MISERKRAKIKIVVSEVPLSKNIYVNMHWAKRKKYKELIGWKIMIATSEIKSSGFKKAKLTFDIYFKANRSRDVANYLGGGLIAWLDELVDQDFIIDDSYDCIGQPIVNFYIDKANPRTEILITERK